MAGAAQVVAPRRLDSPQCASELLAIVGYLTADDGPLQGPPSRGGDVSPWHVRLLLKAAERLDDLDARLRGRVAFLVAGKDRGYRAPEGELELAGVALDTCRAAAWMVDALLAGDLPTSDEFEAMARAALAIYPALEAMRKLEATREETAGSALGPSGAALPGAGAAC